MHRLTTALVAVGILGCGAAPAGAPVGPAPLATGERDGSVDEDHARAALPRAFDPVTVGGHWRKLTSVGYARVGAARIAELTPEHAKTWDVQLPRAPWPFDMTCFELAADTAEGGPTDLEVTVVSERADWGHIGQSIERGRHVDAGFCLAGRVRPMDVRVTVRAYRGSGPTALTLWARHLADPAGEGTDRPP